MHLPPTPTPCRHVQGKNHLLARGFLAHLYLQLSVHHRLQIRIIGLYPVGEEDKGGQEITS